MELCSELHANLVDLQAQRVYAARVSLGEGRITAIDPLDDASIDPAVAFILPGFIDSHIHIESSMLVPSEFARMAVRHGTVATVSDPHEIANVMGIGGVDYMIASGKQVPLKFFFGAPSCVPATPFETAGAKIDAADVERLLARDDIPYLAEMMNYPGVLGGDPEVIRKLQAAKRLGKPIDGHAPGLIGDDASRYIAAGISTDHECASLAEAEHKIKCGMRISIREGSAAKNFDALQPLIDRYPDSIMFCSDDKHPDELAKSHIDALVRRAIQRGSDLFHVLSAACINPIEHYRLPVGRLRPGDPADFVLVRDLHDWEVLSTFIDGRKVFDHGEVLFDRVPVETVNQFGCHRKSPDEFAVLADTLPHHRVIKAIDGSLVTESIDATLKRQNGRLEPDPDRDLLKLTVVNRYRDAVPACCFVQGFGIKDGAIASSVGHDSHNIIAVGSSDDHLAAAVNAVIEQRGGIAMVSRSEKSILPLPVAGIMSSGDGDSVAREYSKIDQRTKDVLGSKLSAPLMTLSFMALLVIPSLKLSDRGLFDADRFEWVDRAAV